MSLRVIGKSSIYERKKGVPQAGDIVPVYEEEEEDEDEFTAADIV